MKTIKKSRFVTITSLFMGFASLISFCFGSWTFIQDKTINAFEVSDAKPVAYISSDASVKYTTVEKALDVAKSGETVYVIPGTNPTIKNNAIIKTGVTLCLPFDGDENTAHTDWTNRKQESGIKFADQTEEDVKTHRKTLVTLSRGVQLTNNGTLEIGGMVGASSSRIPTGQTFGNYAELLMQTNSQLLNKGTINLYGYIKEDSSNNGSLITHYDGASIKMPFVIYDFRGGTYSLAAKDHNIMPFNNYDLPNCQPAQKFLHGSKINGMISLYASKIYSVTDVLILGNENESCLFKMSNGYVSLKYTPRNPLYTTNDVSSSTKFENGNFSYIRVNGNISLASLKVTIGSLAEVDSSKVDCPLDFKYQIIVETGNLTIANKMKFLAGSSVTINKGATLTINSPTMLHQNYVPNITTGGSGLYPSGVRSAKIINNGTLKINASFGGFVETSSETGVVDSTGDGFNSTVSMEEMLEKNGIFSGPKKETHQEKARAFLSLNDNSPESLEIEKNKFYFGKKFEENVYCFVDIGLKIALNVIDKTSLSSEKDKTTLTLSLAPNNSYFDLNPTNIEWELNKTDDSYSNQELSLAPDRLSAQFIAISNPGKNWIGKKITYTYFVNVKIRLKSEYSGNVLFCKSEQISVTGW